MSSPYLHHKVLNMSFCKVFFNSPDTERATRHHVSWSSNRYTWVLPVHHRSPIHPQKASLSTLDLMMSWLSLMDLVTKLASPFCRRLLWAAFCCLVSCLRTFWRTTSCRTHRKQWQQVSTDEYMHWLPLLGRLKVTVCSIVVSTCWHSLANCKTYKLLQLLNKQWYFNWYQWLCYSPMLQFSPLCTAGWNVFIFYLLVVW